MTIRIPDNATNGDILRLLFPSENFEDKGYICQYPLDGMIHDFSSKWWNSSYKVDHENNIDYAGISEAYKMAFKALDQKPLTDKEQRIFLAAMYKEELVCREIDDEYSARKAYEDSLVSLCRSIERKVKKALWT